MASFIQLQQMIITFLCIIHPFVKYGKHRLWLEVSKTMAVCNSSISVVIVDVCSLGLCTSCIYKRMYANDTMLAMACHVFICEMHMMSLSILLFGQFGVNNV